MSTKQEIYDYVMTTPENTNGSVLSSLLTNLPTDGGANPSIIDASPAKTLSDLSGIAVGWEEAGSGTQITWDGATTGRDTFSIVEYPFYKVSTLTPSVQNLNGVNIEYIVNGSDDWYAINNVNTFTEVAALYGFTITSGDGSKLLMPLAGGEEMCIAIALEAQTIVFISGGNTFTITIPSTGMYGVSDGSNTYVKMIQYGNQIIWNGDTTGLECVTFGEQNYYKVSSQFVSDKSKLSNLVMSDVNCSSGTITEGSDPIASANIMTLLEVVTQSGGTIISGDASKIILLMGFGIEAIISMMAQTVVVTLGSSTYTLTGTVGTYFRKYYEDENNYYYISNINYYTSDVIHKIPARFAPTDATKQDLLVSGTNIKTVNSTSILGSGNLSTHDTTDLYYKTIFDAEEIDLGTDNAYEDLSGYGAYNNILYQLVDEDASPLKGCSISNPTNKRAWNIGATSSTSFNDLYIVNGYIFCRSGSTIYYASLPYTTDLPATSWSFSTITTPTNYSAVGIYYMNSSYVIPLIGSTCALYISSGSDLTNWTLYTIDSNISTIRNMIQVNGKFFIQDNGSNIYYSSSLTSSTWSRLSMPLSNDYAKNMCCPGAYTLIIRCATSSSGNAYRVYKLNTESMTFSLIKTEPTAIYEYEIQKCGDVFISSSGGNYGQFKLGYSLDGINWFYGQRTFGTIQPEGYLSSGIINAGYYGTTNWRYIVATYYNNGKRQPFAIRYNEDEEGFYNYENINIEEMFPHDDSKQDILVSGSNIKTINGSSILGSGNLAIYDAGTGINIASNTISADTSVMATKSFVTGIFSLNGTELTITTN